MVKDRLSRHIALDQYSDIITQILSLLVVVEMLLHILNAVVVTFCNLCLNTLHYSTLVEQ